MRTKLIMFLFAQCMIIHAIAQSDERNSWEKQQINTISCEDYHAEVLENGVLYNNVWNKNAAGSFQWRQCLEKDPSQNIYGWSWSWPSNSDTIFSYPQIKVGMSPWAPTPSFNEYFPAHIAELEKLEIAYELDIKGETQHNIATTLWLIDTEELGQQANPAAIVAEIMIWTYATSGHLNPAGAYQGDIKIDGRQWEVWFDENWHDVSGVNQNRWINVTFRSDSSSLQTKFDAKPLLNHAMKNKMIPSDFYIADVELGLEIHSGSGFAWINAFDVDIVR